MKTVDAIGMCLPEGQDELFEMVRFERTFATDPLDSNERLLLTPFVVTRRGMDE